MTVRNNQFKIGSQGKRYEKMLQIQGRSFSSLPKHEESLVTAKTARASINKNQCSFDNSLNTITIDQGSENFTRKTELVSNYCKTAKKLNELRSDKEQQDGMA